MRILLTRVVALFLCLSFSPAFPNALLPKVPRLEQEEDLWCWVATTKMTLDYYHRSPFMSQTEIAKYALGGVALNVPGYLIGGPSGQKSVSNILVLKKDIGTEWTLGVLSMSDFAVEIMAGRPVFIGVSPLSSSDPGHIVLGVGFDTRNGTNTNIGPANEITNVFYNDPDDGTRSRKSFAAMRKNLKWEWDETMRLDTDGPEPPVGIHDEVVVENFPYNFIYPFTHIPRPYRALSGFIPYIWQAVGPKSWMIFFLNGDMLVSSSRGGPSGFSWIRTTASPSMI